MSRMLSIVGLAVIISSATLMAQATPPPPPPAPKAAPGTPPTPPPPPPAKANTPAAPSDRLRDVENVQIDVEISDTFGKEPTTKKVTMLVASGETGKIRSSMWLREPNGGNTSIGINVDARPVVTDATHVLVLLTVQYTPDSPNAASGDEKPASIDESLTTILVAGKRTVVSQSADPLGNRAVTLTVTASVVK